MIGNDPSNLELLKKQFGHAIQFIHDHDSTGLKSSAFAQRATIVFLDGSKLYVTENLNKRQKIETYWYDWVAADGKTILAKYHAEPHDDELYQTKTEPYHSHPPDFSKLTNKTRYPNYLYLPRFIFHCRGNFSVLSVAQYAKAEIKYRSRLQFPQSA